MITRFPISLPIFYHFERIQRKKTPYLSLYKQIQKNTHRIVALRFRLIQNKTKKKLIANFVCRNQKKYTICCSLKLALNTYLDDIQRAANHTLNRYLTDNKKSVRTIEASKQAIGIHSNGINVFDTFTCVLTFQNQFNEFSRKQFLFRSFSIIFFRIDFYDFFLFNY